MQYYNGKNGCVHIKKQHENQSFLTRNGAIYKQKASTLTRAVERLGSGGAEVMRVFHFQCI